MTQLHAPDPAALAGTHIPVRLKLLHRATFVAQRAGFLVGLVQHVPALFTVLVAGVSALKIERDGGGRALAAAELLVAAWVLIVVGRETWHLFGRHAANGLARPEPHAASHESPRIDVASLAAAALGYVEAWHHARADGHLELLSPYIVGGTASLLLAFGGRRAIQKHAPQPELYIEVTPAGIEYRAGPRTSWRAKWIDVAAVEHTQDEIAVRLQSGRRRVLRAADFFDGEALLVDTRAAIAAYAPPRLRGQS
jgi:hypothetical protein